MKKQQLPTGWDSARVQRVLDHYENLSEEEMVAEDEAAHLAGENQLPVLKDDTKTNGKPVAKGTRQQTKAKRPKKAVGSKSK